LIVLTAAFGHAISGRWDRARVANLAKFAGAFGLCVLSPLINPYGFGLYRHVAE
jgi:hypothetical protein